MDCLDIKSDIEIKEESFEESERIIDFDSNSHSLDDTQQEKKYTISKKLKLETNEQNLEDNYESVFAEDGILKSEEDFKDFHKKLEFDEESKDELQKSFHNCSSSNVAKLEKASSSNGNSVMEAYSFFGKKTRGSNEHVEEVDDCETDNSEVEIDIGSDNPDDVSAFLHEEEEFSDSSDGEEDSSRTMTQPSVRVSQVPKSRSDQPKYIWHRVSPSNSCRNIPEWHGRLQVSESIRRPIEYFRDFFSNDILDHIVFQSNLYALQSNPNKPLGLTIEELERFLGILFSMSLVKVSNSRLFWSCEFQYSLVSEAMTRDRWEFIKSNLHCNDNSKMPERTDPNYDRLFKVRPLITHLQNKCRKIPMPQMLCIDEQIVPFKEVSGLKQHNPKEPHKWGFKFFSLCDVTGILYDFDVYDGNIKPVVGEPDIEASSNIVLHLSKHIPTGKNHLLYFNSWFTSLPLLYALAEKKIYSLGTVKQCRLPNIILPSDKELLKKGRGSHVESSTMSNDTEIRAVKWADNRCVTLVSTFSSAQPMSEVERYDKKKKEMVTVPCPDIVKTYNLYKGGVDLKDSMHSLYRIHIRSKKYYHNLIFHLLDIAVVNSWLLYRRDALQLGVKKRKIMPLIQFKLSVSKALLLEGKVISNERGRSSGEITESLHANKKRKGPNTKPIPSVEIRTDNVDHLPDIEEKKGRCKYPGCKGFSVVTCTKCKVNLCLTKKRNCYKSFHTN